MSTWQVVVLIYLLPSSLLLAAVLFAVFASKVLEAARGHRPHDVKVAVSDERYIPFAGLVIANQRAATRHDRS